MGLCCHLVATGMITVVDQFHQMPHPGLSEAQREGEVFEVSSV